MLFHDGHGFRQVSLNSRPIHPPLSNICRSSNYAAYRGPSRLPPADRSFVREREKQGRRRRTRKCDGKWSESFQSENTVTSRDGNLCLRLVHENTESAKPRSNYYSIRVTRERGTRDFQEPNKFWSFRIFLPEWSFWRTHFEDAASGVSIMSNTQAPI